MGLPISNRCPRLGAGRGLQFDNDGMYVCGADVLAAVRDGPAPENVASFALEDTNCTVRIGIADAIIVEGIEHILGMTVLTLALAGFQEQFENTDVLVLEFHGKAGRLFRLSGRGSNLCAVLRCDQPIRFFARERKAAALVVIELLAVVGAMAFPATADDGCS